MGRGGTRGKATWLQSYRRSATGLAARRFGVVSCQLAGTDRHSTKGLVACVKGQRDLEIPLGLLPCEISRPTLKHLNWRWLTCSSTQAAAKQSGDRQRREKGSPILTAEKGEHERAPPVCESWPTPLRATLRAPPSKWAIRAFFRRVSVANQGRGQPRRGYRRPKPATRSGAGRLRSRRAACFLWYFLSLRKKVLPPSGRQPHRPRRSRRVKPSSAKEGLRLRAHQRAFLGANNRRGSHCRALRLLFA